MKKVCLNEAVPRTASSPRRSFLETSKKAEERREEALKADIEAKQWTVLRHLSHFLPHSALKIAAEGLVTSHIRYCLPLFGPIRHSDFDPKRWEQEKLQVIHNHMVRTLHSLKIKDKINMEKLRKAKNILSINQMTYQSIAMEMRKSISHNTLPQTFSSICKNCTPDNRTRSYSQSLFRPPKCRLSSTMSSFSSKATSVWNKLPIELRDPKLSNASFKTKLKTWLKGTIIP